MFPNNSSKCILSERFFLQVLLRKCQNLINAVNVPMAHVHIWYCAYKSNWISWFYIFEKSTYIVIGRLMEDMWGISDEWKRPPKYVYVIILFANSIENPSWASVRNGLSHYNDVTMGAIASQITILTTVYSTVYSDADQRKHQSSASLAFVRGIHRGSVNSPHKWPVTRKMSPLMTSSGPSGYVFQKS